MKTDRRDTLKLARLLRAGELKAIYIPETTDEDKRLNFAGRVGTGFSEKPLHDLYAELNNV